MYRAPGLCLWWRFSLIRFRFRRLVLDVWSSVEASAASLTGGISVKCDLLLLLKGLHQIWPLCGEAGDVMVAGTLSPICSYHCTILQWCSGVSDHDRSYASSFFLNPSKKGHPAGICLWVWCSFLPINSFWSYTGIVAQDCYMNTDLLTVLEVVLLFGPHAALPHAWTHMTD